MPGAPAFTLIVSVILLLSTRFVAAQDHNADEVFRLAGRNYRMGMEIELTLRPLAQMVRVFDWEVYQQAYRIPDSLDETVMDHYLDDRANFEALPEALRLELSRNLSLDVTLHRGDVPIPSELASTLEAHTVQRFPSQAGSPTRTNLGTGQDPDPASGAGLILQRPNSNTPSPIVDARGHSMEGGSGLVLPPNARAQSDTQELIRRWRRLPRSVQLQNIRFSRLPPLELARLIMHNRIEVRHLRHRQDLPDETRRLLSRLNWSMDPQGAMEFRHNDTVVINNPEEFLHDVQTFSRLAGVQESLSQIVQSNHAGRAGYHFHISREGADFRRQATVINLVSLFELAGQGVDGGPSVRYGHRFIQLKGNNRLVSGDRVEFRSHVHHPRQALANALFRLESLPGAELDLLNAVRASLQLPRLEASDPSISNHEALQREMRRLLLLGVEHTNELIAQASIITLIDSHLELDPEQLRSVMRRVNASERLHAMFLDYVRTTSADHRCLRWTLVAFSETANVGLIHDIYRSVRRLHAAGLFSESLRNSVRSLLEHGDMNVRVTALDSFLIVNDPSAVSYAREFLATDNTAMQRAALSAFTQLNLELGREDYERLAALMNASGAGVQERAIEFFVRPSNPLANQDNHLVAVLGSSSAYRHSLVIRRLRERLTPALEQRLMDLIRENPHALGANSAMQVISESSNELTRNFIRAFALGTLAAESRLMAQRIVRDWDAGISPSGSGCEVILVERIRIAISE